MVGYILSPHPRFSVSFFARNTASYATIDPLQPIQTIRTAMDPNNPRETWSRIQKAIHRASQQPGGRGPPKGVLGGGATLILLGAAWVTFNSAIFNGARKNCLICLKGVEMEMNNWDLGKAFG